MFRGKESLNRIELSRLVPRLIEFCCFGLPAGTGEGADGWGGVRGIWGHGGCPPHMHMHTHAHTCTYTH